MGDISYIQCLYRSGFVWSALRSALRRVGAHSAPRSKKSRSGVVKSLRAPESLDRAPLPLQKIWSKFCSTPLRTNTGYIIYYIAYN